MPFRLQIYTPNKKIKILVYSDIEGLAAFLPLLKDVEFAVSSEHAKSSGQKSSGNAMILFIPGATKIHHSEIEAIPSLSGAMAWNRWNLQHFPLDVYKHGIRKVIPHKFKEAYLLETLLEDNAAFQNMRKKTLILERNEQILLVENQVVFIKKGFLRCTHLREDGEESFLGIYGVGDLLLGQDPDYCFVSVVAHADSAIIIKEWREALLEDDFHEKLMRQVWFLEKWAATLGKSNMEDRLTGLLRLLAKKFGEEDPYKLLQRLRLTHEHLAQALGSARPSITRAINKIKSRAAV